MCIFPITKLTYGCLISFVATHHSPLHQLDIRNAFLRGILDEEQLPDFVAQQKFGQVYHLKKSLQGLKQSLRVWFERFASVV